MERPAFAVYPAGARMPMRELDDWELVWVTRGRATLTGTPRIELRAGHLLLLPAGHPHGFDWNPRGVTEHGYVHFELESVPDEVDQPVYVPMTRDDPLTGLCAYLRWLGSAQVDAWEWAVTATIGQIMQHMLSLPRPDTIAATKLPDPVERAVRHLRTAWSPPPLARVSVEELASSASVSPVHLNRLFRATCDLSVAAGVEQLRCLYAATLLERTDLSTTQIARQCGFADVSHFSHRFRAVTGGTPTSSRGSRAPLHLRTHPGLRHLEQVVLGA